MPRPSAIWVCDSPNCCRIRRKRGPTNSFLPASAAITASSFCDNNYKITYHTSEDVTIHHQSAASLLYYFQGFAFSSWHVSQCTVTNVDTMTKISDAHLSS